MTTKKEKLLHNTYEKYLDLVLHDFPLDRINEIAVKDVMGYGTTIDEKIIQIEDLRELVIRQREQSKGAEINFNIERVSQKLFSNDEAAVIVDEILINMIIDEKKNVIPVRLSTVLEFLDNNWKVIHWHASVAVESEDDTWHINEWKKKNEELQKLVDEKTAELEQKNRNLEIEAALERVRARAMGMRQSDELQELVSVVFHELTELDIKLTRCIIWIFNPDDLSSRMWMANPEDELKPRSFYIPFHKHKTYEALIKAWKENLSIWVYDLNGETKASWDKILFTETGLKNLPEVVQQTMREPERVIITASFNNFGTLQAAGLEPLSEEQCNILKRFGKVFDLSYTRFIDLQRAETQTKEAKIEAALERIRAKAMSMHKSDELREVIACIFQQLQDLGFEAPACSLVIYQEDLSANHWFAGYSHDSYPESYTIPYVDNPYYTDLLEAWQKGSSYEEFIMEGQAKVDYARWLLEHSEFKNLPKEFVEQSGMLTPNPLYFADAYMRYGMVEIIGNESLSEERVVILKRISEVFEQTYTRFLDLQKAEAQAREAQIEAALERVRSKTMAMHNSQDVGDTVIVLFDEVLKLGIDKSIRCGIGILEGTEKKIETWSATSYSNGEVDLKMGMLDMTIHPMLIRLKKAWKSGETGYSYQFTGNDVIRYYNALNNEPEYPFHVELDTLPEKEFHNSFFFSEGILFAFTSNPISEEAAKVLNKFASVFGQTYRRYLDLQKAEAQAREAQIETALERVRSKTMAMHKSDDLTSAVATVFEELRKLGLKTIRCGVGIFDGKNRKINVWTSSSSEKSDSVQVSGDERLEGHSLLDGIYDSWQRQQDFSYVLEGEDLTKYYKVVADSNLPVKAPEVNAANDIQYYHCVMFPAGGLFAFRESEFSAEAIRLMKRFADVFHLAFIRHLDLKNAEAQNKIIQADNERKTQELEEARQLQLSMLPKELPNLPNLDIAVYMQTATEVGGDYYDFQVGIDGTLTTIIGDATGHGMKAGTVVTITKSLFNSMAANENILSTFDKIS